MKKNIIYITGNDSYGVELEVKRWLGAFRGKFGDINIDRYDLSEAENLRGIGDMILMSGLFAEKRLFIFRGGRDRKSKAQGLESILTEKIEHLPDEHFLLFHNISSKEEGLIDWLSKNADVRKIDTLYDTKSWSSRYDIKIETLQLVLSTYRSAESSREKGDTNDLIGHDIAHTIEMISLLETSGKHIDKQDIVSLCHGYRGDTLFALVDSIMSVDIAKCMDIYRRIINTTRVDEWLASLIGLLRNNVYIKYLQYHGVGESEIAKIVPIHPYVLKKGYASKIEYPHIKKLYKKLIATSIAYKKGKGLKESELGRILAIELALLDLQISKNT